MATGTQERGSRQTVADNSHDGPLPVRPPLDSGAQIGRYHVLQRVGAGGMGVVYAAYDPDLDRRVAIKLLQHELSGRGSLSDGRALLLREAQAMAKLSHPNVVTVHDVGVHEDSVFLAMEFVQGKTLGDWMEQPRSWQEVVAVFRAAGRGLAAAHDAGLVHRDFKPDNVMLSDGGKVKVTDFGLARARDDRAHERIPTAKAEAVPPSSGAHSLTQTGAVVGTPAYMAPEQHLGLKIDARSDQFSYCVAFYEALYGERPFVADAGMELAMKVVEGRLGEPPVGAKVPAWLRQIVVRGLAPAPDSRWPSMAVLLAELARDPTAARRRSLVAVGAVVALGAGAFGVHELGAARSRACSGMDEHLVGVWDGDARERVEAAVFATGVGFAQSTWERVARGLDDYASGWIAAREDACEATQVRGEQSPELMDLRMECLDARLRDVRALVHVLEDADTTVVQNAVIGVDGLGPLEPCADAKALRSEDPLPDDPRIAAEIARLEERLADAEAHASAAKYGDALAIAREVAEAAEPLGWAPLTARAQHRRGVLEHVTGDDGAEPTLQGSFFLAVRHDLADVAAHSAAELVMLVGEDLSRPAEGRRWAEHAAAYADRDGRELLQAKVMHNLAGVAFEEG
ncbi:MAG TPA: serine/threonine-protein kinase, partial [Nannocystaceae bacterium]|nr:serine/threonine-protein kinase [Nannocystaceae bacterium]